MAVRRFAAPLGSAPGHLLFMVWDLATRSMEDATPAYSAGAGGGRSFAKARESRRLLMVTHWMRAAAFTRPQRRGVDRVWKIALASRTYDKSWRHTWPEQSGNGTGCRSGRSPRQAELPQDVRCPIIYSLFNVHLTLLLSYCQSYRWRQYHSWEPQITVNGWRRRQLHPRTGPAAVGPITARGGREGGRAGRAGAGGVVKGPALRGARQRSVWRVSH